MNKIYISKDLQNAKNEIAQNLNGKIVKTFYFEDFGIDEAREAIAEAYKKEEMEKYIILCSNSFNIYAQNSLLKIIEESPDGVFFILIAPSKNIFLPTIRSRVAIIDKNEKREKNQLSLNLKNLDLKSIYEFLISIEGLQKDEQKKDEQKKDGSQKRDLKNIIQDIFTKAIEEGIEFNQRECELFEKSIYLADLNTKATSILSALLLMIASKKSKNKI